MERQGKINTHNKSAVRLFLVPPTKQKGGKQLEERPQHAETQTIVQIKRDSLEQKKLGKLNTFFAHLPQWL